MMIFFNNDPESIRYSLMLRELRVWARKNFKSPGECVKFFASFVQFLLLTEDGPSDLSESTEEDIVRNIDKLFRKKIGSAFDTLRDMKSKKK